PAGGRAATLAGGDVHRLAGLELEPAQLEGARERLLVGHRHGDLVVQVPTVARDARPLRRAVWSAAAAAATATAPTSSARGADDLNALAAILVIHPDSAGRRAAFAAATPALAHDYVVAVGRPGRLERRGVQVGEHRALVRAVGIHDPEVVLAAAVGDEGDGLAVGRD